MHRLEQGRETRARTRHLGGVWIGYGSRALLGRGSRSSKSSCEEGPPEASQCPRGASAARAAALSEALAVLAAGFRHPRATLRGRLPAGCQSRCRAATGARAVPRASARAALTPQPRAADILLVGLHARRVVQPQPLLPHVFAEGSGVLGPGRSSTSPVPALRVIIGEDAAAGEAASAGAVAAAVGAVGGRRTNVALWASGGAGGFAARPTVDAAVAAMSAGPAARRRGLRRRRAVAAAAAVAAAVSHTGRPD